MECIQVELPSGLLFVTIGMFQKVKFDIIMLYFLFSVYYQFYGRMLCEIQHNDAEIFAKFRTAGVFCGGERTWPSSRGADFVSFITFREAILLAMVLLMYRLNQQSSHFTSANSLFILENSDLTVV